MCAVGVFWSILTAYCMWLIVWMLWGTDDPKTDWSFIMCGKIRGLLLYWLCFFNLPYFTSLWYGSLFLPHKEMFFAIIILGFYISFDLLTWNVQIEQDQHILNNFSSFILSFFLKIVYSSFWKTVTIRPFVY